MTSSCNATAPIDIPTKTAINPIAMKFNCVYDSNLCSGAALTIAPNLSHASINCNASNSSAITFSGIKYMPTEIRIYAPSLHTYNGATAAAEMLIVHSPNGTNSRNSNSNSNNNSNTDSANTGLIVSIPIQITSSSANSDLTAIVKAMNSISASTIALNASAPINDNINVNSFIPAKPYYVYYGTLPYDSCGGNYYYAVFTDPIYARGALSNLSASNIATVPQSMKTNLQKSKTGPVTGVDSGSAEEYVLFQVVGNEDESCDASNDANADLNANADSNNNAKDIGINVICGILIAIAVMGIAWLFRKWNGSSAAPSAAPSTAPSTTPSAAPSAIAT